MRLDLSHFRFITKEEFRVMTSTEMGMRNHEFVPAVLIESIAKVTRGSCYKILQSLLRNKLLVHDGQKYDGYRLSYLGFDYLALRALAARGSIISVGRRLGVGKESDVHFAQGANGEMLALKLHRLGRISFRAIKQKRDYMKGREHASWMYMARLAAIKEFAYMKALADEGFPVPKPVDQNRHCVVMSYLDAVPMMRIRRLRRPEAVLERLMRLLVRLARAGVVHGDFNEFNLMIDSDEKITLIDFPQLVHMNHANAEEYFLRDVKGVTDFFRKRLSIEVTESPQWEEVNAMYAEIQARVEVEASGGASASLLRGGKIEGLGRDEDALLVAAHDKSRETGEGDRGGGGAAAKGGEEGESGEEDEEDDDGEPEEEDEEEEEDEQGAADVEGAADPKFKPLLAEGASAAGIEEEPLEEALAEDAAAAIAGAYETPWSRHRAGRRNAANAEAEADAEGDGDATLWAQTAGGHAGLAAAKAKADAANAEEKGSEAGDSEGSEEVAAPGQVGVQCKRTRKKTGAKDAKKNLQRQQKTHKAKPNNQKSKELRKAKHEIKEWLGS